MLALEAVRVFLPDVFARLHVTVDALTTPSGFRSGTSDPPELRAAVEALVAVAEPHQDVIRALVMRLFPAGARHVGGTHYAAGWERQWLRERRVAHVEILRLYLERVAGEGLLAFIEAERAWAVMTDQEELDQYLRGLDPDRLQDVITALETYEDEFKPEQVVPASVVLLNLLPDLPARQQAMFDLEPRLVVARVTVRLLRSLHDPGVVEEKMDQILPRLTNLSSKLSVITDVGYREGAGHKLVSADAAARYERRWRDEVRAASVDDLVRENDLLRVLAIAKGDATGEEPVLTIAADPALTLSLLHASVSEVRAQTIGNRAVRRATRLSWDTLVGLYGSEDTVRERFEALKATDLDLDDHLREVVEKYLSGWRPGDFERW